MTAPEMPRAPAEPLKGEEIDRGFAPCAECCHPEYIGCHHCPRGVRFAVGDSEGWRLDHFAGIGCIAFCPDCRSPGTAREDAQPGADGTGTSPAGSGRGTGVAEASGTAQESASNVAIPKRLTEPQRQLLEEIRESSTGGLYVDRYMRYYRTAKALERRGLVTRRFVDGRNDFFAPAPAPSLPVPGEEA